jgi:hypothetical protein
MALLIYKGSDDSLGESRTSQLDANLFGRHRLQLRLST